MISYLKITKRHIDNIKSNCGQGGPSPGDWEVVLQHKTASKYRFTIAMNILETGSLSSPNNSVIHNSKINVLSYDITLNLF